MASEREPLLNGIPAAGASSRTRRVVLGSVVMGVLGLAAAAAVVHQFGGGDGGRAVLVTQGIASEAANDAAVVSALGKKDGDTTKDVKEATEEAVKKAQEETEEAVKAEIDEAVTKGETEGKAVYDEDIAKYKGQEADMGHTGWVDVYSGEKDATPEVLKGRAASMQKLAMAEARKAAGKH